MSRNVFYILLCSWYSACASDNCNWRDLAVRDTLDVFLMNAVVGYLVHSVEFREKEKTVVDRTTLCMNADLSGGGGAENRMEVRETRTFSDPGGLVSAYQELIGQSGTNSWSLDKNSTGWVLTAVIGGQTTRKNIPAVTDNLLSDCRMRLEIRNKSMRTGARWQDTVLELMSGRPIVTSTVCTGVDTVRKLWSFKLTDDLSGRTEKCVLDAGGLIIERSLEGMYTAKRRAPPAGGGKTGASLPAHAKGADRRPDAATITELFAVPADRPCEKGESPAVVFTDSALSIDSSARFLYNKQGGRWILKSLPGHCRAQAAGGHPDAVNQWLKPGMAIQSDHPKIVELSKKLLGRKTDPCLIIAEFNRYVFSHVQKRNSAVFSNALETLIAGYGDCGEHAALLTALLRAAGIPARVALGLLYVDSKKQYLYHAQVLAYAGEWLLADPTWDVFPASGRFMPLIIDDSGAQAMLLSRLIGKIRIEYAKK